MKMRADHVASSLGSSPMSAEALAKTIENEYDKLHAY